MNFDIRTTDSQDINFLTLVRLLDTDLDERYGAIQKQYAEHNKVDYLKDVVVILKDNKPVACGALKEYDQESVELKRIFVVKESRKQGLGRVVINKLEEFAAQKGYRSVVLETGIKQHEAINLYRSIGYRVTENYGPYVGNSNSVCMKKILG
jgi:GNAT superfamily N-acetyltransferase